jgi:hypothetical protein
MDINILIAVGLVIVAFGIGLLVLYILLKVIKAALS